MFCSKRQRGKAGDIKQTRQPRMKLIICLLAFAALLSLLLATCLGPVRVPPGTVLRIVCSRLPGLKQLVAQDWTLQQQNIVLLLRLPRVLLGLVVGACLAVAGVAMQALVRNQLADPFVLGVSSGASAFATLGMLFGSFSFLGAYSLSISAFLGAAASIVLVFLLARQNGRINITHLLLSGVIIAMIMESITKIITLSAPNALGLHNVSYWMSGSLANSKWAYLLLPTAAMLLCLLMLMLRHRALNALLLGEDVAASLGVNVPRTQAMLLLVASLCAGLTVSVAGTIGFVGLMVPHLARLLVGADHKKVLPISALLGGLLVIWVDVLARMLIAPEELPLGVLTAIIGGPVFIVLLKRKKQAALL